MDGRLLRQLDALKQEAQQLRSENRHLRLDRDAWRIQLHEAGQRIDRLERRLEKAQRERDLLAQRVADLSGQLGEETVSDTVLTAAGRLATGWSWAEQREWMWRGMRTTC